jgi:hypothetical protein
MKLWNLFLCSVLHFPATYVLLVRNNFVNMSGSYTTSGFLSDWETEFYTRINDRLLYIFNGFFQEAKELKFPEMNIYLLFS